MSNSAQFVAWVQEQLAPLGRIAVRRMFSGYGIYCDGLFFAIVVNDTLYLKTDEASRAQFEGAGSDRFEYERKGRTASIGYYTAPEEAMDSPAALLEWARLALAAALRNANTPKGQTTFSKGKRGLSPKRTRGAG
jgi:DNA transformation protein